MATFILGVPDSDSFGDPELLVEYATEKEADYASEEWARVEAENLPEARLKYEETFDAWQASQNLPISVQIANAK